MFTSNHFAKSLLSLFYFDLPPIGYFFAPVWIAHLLGSRNFKFNHILFCISTLITTLLFAIDTFYYPFNGKHINIGIIELVKDPGNSITPYLRSYWYIILLVITALYFLYTLYNKANNTLYLRPVSKNIYSNSIILLITVALLFFSIRGGLQTRPLRSIDIAKYAPTETISAINTAPLEIISTIDRKLETEPTFGRSDNLNFNISVTSEIKDKKNICFIIIESMSMEYLQMSNAQLTPFLNRLKNKSTLYTHCFANGRKSKEMAPSIFASIPQLFADDYISTPYSQNNITSAFTYFNKLGYSTTFYHGGANGTMEFQSFFKQIGLQTYKGKDEYKSPKDYDGAWGIYDRPYLSYWGNEIDQLKTPFFTSLFTLSSHHPYAIEQQYQNLKKGPYENSQSIRYIDTGLAQFFNQIKDKSWFKNTLFVITADHTSISEDPFYSNGIGKYWIPLLIYDPANPKKMTEEQTLAQVDILPLAMKLAGATGIYFGANAHHATIGNMAIIRNDGYYTGIAYPYVCSIQLNGQLHRYAKIENKQEKELKPDETCKIMQAHMQDYIRQTYNLVLNNAWHRQ